MSLTLAEEVLLLVLRDDTGKPWVDGTRLSAALAGAAIVDLTMDGSLRLTEKGDPAFKPGRLVRSGSAPSDPRLSAILEVAHDRKPKDAIGRVSGLSSWRGKSDDLKNALLLDLAEAGVLAEEKGKVLGLFPTTAWKPVDPAPEAEVVERVRQAVLGGAEPMPRTAALISVLHAIDLLPKVFKGADKKALKRRAKEISESDWAGAAVRKAVQEVQAVMTTLVVASAVAVTGG